MDVKRLVRIARRLNDRHYIKYGTRHLGDRLFLRRYLPLLFDYHQGSRFDFSSIKNRRLTRIVRYARAHCPYYKELLDDQNISTKNLLAEWDRIPYLNKEIIRREKDRLLAVPASKGYVGYFNTGGSTGEPLGFPILGGCDAEHQEFLYRMIGYEPGDRILAIDASVVPDDLLKKGIFWIKKSDQEFPYGSMALSAHYLGSDNMDRYIYFLNELKPSIIRSYPSVIIEIASHLLKSGIPLSFKMKGIELTSEAYYDHQIDSLRSAFKTRVFNQYGHSEACIFGYSLDESLLTYCSPLYGHTEILDADRRHVRPGEIGEVVVTGFTNYAMPFIRYQTGDYALYDGEEHGIVRLGRIMGRTQDYVYKKNMDKAFLTAILFDTHLRAFKNIVKWQIRQKKPGEIALSIVRSPDFTAADQNEISDIFKRIAGIETEFIFVDQIPKTRSGKHRFLIQDL